MALSSFLHSQGLSTAFYVKVRIRVRVWREIWGLGENKISENKPLRNKQKAKQNKKPSPGWWAILRGVGHAGSQFNSVPSYRYGVMGEQDQTG